MNICMNNYYVIVAFEDLSCIVIQVFIQFSCFISIIKSHSGIHIKTVVFNSTLYEGPI